jgi:hypothetical protein
MKMLSIQLTVCRLNRQLDRLPFARSEALALAIKEPNPDPNPSVAGFEHRSDNFGKCSRNNGTEPQRAGTANAAHFGNAYCIAISADQ